MQESLFTTTSVAGILADACSGSIASSPSEQEVAIPNNRNIIPTIIV